MSADPLHAWRAEDGTGESRVTYTEVRVGAGMLYRADVGDQTIGGVIRFADGRWNWYVLERLGGRDGSATGLEDGQAQLEAFWRALSASDGDMPERRGRA
jgi:hypothetical protein